ncbi:uncharacterized protein LOC121791134 [Salvia splendens]|uniref:uncharacterized protein LOC121791134 n=1 Tax=Salvia splendens TaxID=180675 RepID=UPI001C25BAFD|nr:uncharacterized protein LOC121791134 [Salvia splendens]
MEKKVIDRFYHEHPLILIENVSNDETPNCYGCGIPVNDLEVAYVCTVQNCSNRIILHKKCGELPSQILHPKHPEHPLYLFDYHRSLGLWCDMCTCDLGKMLGYQCSSCMFDFDLRCKRISIDDILEGERQIEHPSHPNHPLTLMRKPLFSFYCDGCGVNDVDMVYICSTCEFMIHKSCASLPLLLPINLRYHHHRLSLAFIFPMEYRKYIFNCDVCFKRLDRTSWVYFCGDCRFFAHIRCVASTTTEIADEDSNLGGDDDGFDVVEFPLHARDISKELITPFVMREKGLNNIPDVADMPATVKMPETTARFSFLFNYHNHPLSLVSELPHKDDEVDHNDIMDARGEDDVLKICDVCVTPISSPPYYACAATACMYFVHSICYLLPKTLSSSAAAPSLSPYLYCKCPEPHYKTHRFTLYTSSELTDMDDSCQTDFCHGCTYYFNNSVAYCCSSSDCDFALHVECAMLPASITRREWNECHPLVLEFHASFDHPSDFICDFCEEELHPRRWMYQCRPCDLSFHLLCLDTASGGYRNIKFGRRFVLDGIHRNHPLTFNWITIKRRCDICHRNVYSYCGLECAPCYYVVCMGCARTELAKMMY